MMPEIVLMNLSHPRLGCGWRPYVVIQRGHKRARVFEPSALVSVSIRVESLRGARTIDTAPGRVAKRIRENRSQARRLKLPDGGKWAKLAITLLTQRS
jgi:hypothetical protein